jgi:phage-related protein
MFTVIFHNDAEMELLTLPTAVRAKITRLLKKLEANPWLLREPDTKYLGDGLFEIRSMGTEIARGLWVYQKGERIFLLRIFIKKSQKTPRSEIDLAFRRLEEMKNETQNA